MMLRSAASRTLRTNFVVSSNVSCASYTQSPLLDFRRQNERKKWKLPLDPEAEFTVFPNERLGRQYDVNWEFNAYQVTPSEEAYRNLHLRGLQMLTPGKVNEQKNLCIQTEEPSDHQIFFLPSEKITSNVNTIPKEAWKAAIRQIRMQLSFEPELFMHDGLIGSSRNTSISGRLMSNSPTAALQLHYAMAPTPQRKPEKFPHEITGWMYETDDFKFPKENFGITPNNYTLVDLDTRRFITIGKLSQTVIKKSLLAAAGDYFTSQKNSLLLNCDTVANGTETGLVFSLDGSPVSKSGSLNLFSAQGTIWGPNGLARVWDSVSYDHIPSLTSRGELVENLGKETRFTRKLANPFGVVAPHPKILVVVDPNGKSSVSKLDAEQLGEKLSKLPSPSLVLSQNEQLEKLQQMISEQNIACYLVGGTKDLSGQIQAAFNGEETSKTTKPRNTRRKKTKKKE